MEEIDAVERQSGLLASTTPTGTSSGPWPAPGSPGDSAGGVVVGSISDKYNIEFIEGVALENFNFIATMKMEMIGEGSKNWSACKERCQMMGFMLQEDCPWLYLGLAKLESAEPDRNQIKGRGRLLEDQLATVSDASIEPKEVEERAKLIIKTNDFKDRCLAELGGVLAARQAARAGKDKLMRWAEVDGMTRTWMASEFEDGTAEALGLSNILRESRPEVNRVIHLEMEEARSYTGDIWKGGKDALKVFEELGGKEIVIW